MRNILKPIIIFQQQKYYLSSRHDPNLYIGFNIYALMDPASKGIHPFPSPFVMAQFHPALSARNAIYRFQKQIHGHLHR